MKPYVYIIGALKNPVIPAIANELQLRLGWEVFADWHGAGEFADTAWKHHEQARGFTFAQALQRPAAVNTFMFDRRHLGMATHVVLVAPAGKSGHVELGWALGKGKKGYYLLEPDVDRWDIMLNFCDGVAGTIDELVGMIKGKNG